MAQRAHAGQAARERFLLAASENLLVSSSTISARLGSQYVGLIDDTQSTSGDLSLCKGCGSCLILGWSCRKTSSHASSTHKKQKTKTAERISHKAKPIRCRFLRCDVCGTKSPISITEGARCRRPQLSRVPDQKASDLDGRSNAASTIAAATITEQSTEATAPKANQDHEVHSAEQPTISKKRPRAKKTSGLQALLAQRKVDAKAPGLDLMDFMKGAR